MKAVPNQLDDLDAIDAPEDIPIEEDTRSAKFKTNLAEQRSRSLTEENKSLKSTRKLRKKSAKSAFRYLCALSSGVFVLLLLDGFHVRGFSLSVTVLTTLAGGTFVSAIGLFGIVVKGLFPHRS